MAINFPTSPSTNDTFTVGSITYKWDGAKWIGLGVTPTDRLIEGSNSLEINASNELVWTGGNTILGYAGNSLHFQNGFNNSTARIQNGGGSNSSNLKFLVKNAGTEAEAFHISSAGNVGINRTNPDQKLNVNGCAEFNAYDSASGAGGYFTAKGLIIGNLYDAGKSYTGSDDRTACIWQERGLDLDFATNDALRMKITYDGKVGINESNPDRQLSVYDASNSGVEIKSNTDGQSSVFFTDTADGNIGMIGYYHSDDEMFFRVNDQTRLTIDSGGQLGLNQTDPADRLHVKGAMLREGYSDGAVVKTIVMTASFGAGTHDIFTCTATGLDNTAVATMEYVSLFAYSGNNHCAGVKLASTRRSANNTAWENLPNVNVAGPNGSDTSIDPNLFFQNGVLMVTIPGSTQVTATVRITTRSFTLVRNYSAG